MKNDVKPEVNDFVDSYDRQIEHQQAPAQVADEIDQILNDDDAVEPVTMRRIGTKFRADWKYSHRKSSEWESLQVSHQC